MFPHTLTQLVKNGLPGFKNESIVVSYDYFLSLCEHSTVMKALGREMYFSTFGVLPMFCVGTVFSV